MICTFCDPFRSPLPALADVVGLLSPRRQLPPTFSFLFAPFSVWRLLLLSQGTLLFFPRPLPTLFTRRPAEVNLLCPSYSFPLSPFFLPLFLTPVFLIFLSLSSLHVNQSTALTIFYFRKKVRRGLKETRTDFVQRPAALTRFFIKSEKSFCEREI